MSTSSHGQGESRKRAAASPHLSQGDSHSHTPGKRTNSPSRRPMNLEKEIMHFKILVPSVAAGAIIGKGGETIAQLQQETGARIRMSKANDCYPGTNERVCLVLGNLEMIEIAHDFIMSKISEKPDHMHRDDEEMSSSSRMQADRDRQVKILVPNCTAGMIIGKGGAYIKQIQEETGAYLQISQKAKDQRLPERCITIVGDNSQWKKACRMILEKIAEDPNSGSCPDVSYASAQQPVANFNPSGSPFATSSPGQLPSQASTQAMGGNNQLAQATAMLQLFSSVQIAPQQFLDNMQVMLKNTGYPDPSVAEIMSAMQTLLKYGLLGIALGLPNLGSSTNTSTNTPSMPYSNTQQQQQQHNYSYNGTSSFPFGGEQQQQGGFGGSDSTSQLIATMASMVSNQGGGGAGGGGGGKSQTVEMEVPENLVGVIIGPGGKSIVDLQSSSGTNIQVSKKGVYAPGTTNRVVTITGGESNVMNAQHMIQQVISTEELRRTTHENSR